MKTNKRKSTKVSTTESLVLSSLFAGVRPYRSVSSPVFHSRVFNHGGGGLLLYSSQYSRQTSSVAHLHQMSNLYVANMRIYQVLHNAKIKFFGFPTDGLGLPTACVWEVRFGSHILMSETLYPSVASPCAGVIECGTGA